MNIESEEVAPEEQKEETKVQAEQLLVNKEDILSNENFLPSRREMEGRKVTFFTDNYGRICKAQKECEDLFGMDVSEFLTKNFFELMDNVSLNHFYETYGNKLFKTANQQHKTLIFVLRHSHEKNQLCNIKVVTSKLTRGHFKIDAPAERYNYDHTNQVEYVDEGKRLKIHGIRIDIRLSSPKKTAQFRKRYMESVMRDINTERQKLNQSELKNEELRAKFTYSEMIKELEKLKAQSSHLEHHDRNFDNSGRAIIDTFAERNRQAGGNNAEGDGNQ